jgi:HEAT repeat protein
VGEVTLWRWLKLPEFIAAYREARRESMEKATAQLQSSGWAASTTLIKLLGANSESVRLRAATAILDQANKGLEMLDHEERLAALEELAESRRQR